MRYKLKTIYYNCSRSSISALNPIYIGNLQHYGIIKRFYNNSLEYGYKDIRPARCKLSDKGFDVYEAKYIEYKLTNQERKNLLASINTEKELAKWLTNLVGQKIFMVYKSSFNSYFEKGDLYICNTGLKLFIVLDEGFKYIPSEHYDCPAIENAEKLKVFESLCLDSTCKNLKQFYLANPCAKLDNDGNIDIVFYSDTRLNHELKKVIKQNKHKILRDMFDGKLLKALDEAGLEPNLDIDVNLYPTFKVKE